MSGRGWVVFIAGIICWSFFVGLLARAAGANDLPYFPLAIVIVGGLFGVVFNAFCERRFKR